MARYKAVTEAAKLADRQIEIVKQAVAAKASVPCYWCSKWGPCPDHRADTSAKET